MSGVLGLGACEDGEGGAGATVEDAGDGENTAEQQTGSDSGDGGASQTDMDSGDSGAGPDEMDSEDLGVGDGSDVLMIGDSWMSVGGAETAIQGGLLQASDQPYRAEGIGGTALLGEGLIGAPIPDQYEMAIDANPDVKTVIMTGGGNDILLSGLQEDCDMMGDACGEQVVMILDALSDLWAQMAEDGVRDVVYVLYATPDDETVDFALPDGDSAPARCAAVPSPLRCHIVETLDLVMGDIPDGIHPSEEASDRIGQAVYDLMVERGMRR